VATSKLDFASAFEGAADILALIAFGIGWSTPAQFRLEPAAGLCLTSPAKQVI
jgi:hypothetical protein